MPHLGFWEIGFIVVLAFLIFGPKRLPELARSIGEGIREFKKSISGTEERSPASDREEPNAAPKG
ncbi:MAG: Sec-independent protein translocase subunit TatA/TatB [Armatimonadota bacterium]